METNHQTETYKSLIQISLEGFRYLALMNGATWLTVLAFSDKSSEASPSGVLVKLSVLLFIASLTLTAFCYLGSWLTQLCLHNENRAQASKGAYKFTEGRHKIPMWSTVVVFVLASIVYFVAAVVALIAI